MFLLQSELMCFFRLIFSLRNDFNTCDVPPQRPYPLQSTACTPRPSPSPALTEPFTPYSGHLIYQVGATFTHFAFMGSSRFGLQNSKLIAFKCKTLSPPVIDFNQKRRNHCLINGDRWLWPLPGPTHPLINQLSQIVTL